LWNIFDIVLDCSFSSGLDERDERPQRRGHEAPAGILEERSGESGSPALGNRSQGTAVEVLPQPVLEVGDDADAGNRRLRGEIGGRDAAAFQPAMGLAAAEFQDGVVQAARASSSGSMLRRRHGPPDVGSDLRLRPRAFEA
jgi:hypothetical protein